MDSSGIELSINEITVNNSDSDKELESRKRT